jgi:hypothetical protein
LCSEIALSALTDFKLWPLDSAGYEILTEITTESMLYSYFIIGNSIVSLIPLILFVVPVRNDEDGFFALYIFDNWFPDYNVVLNWIYRSTFPVLTYAMICGPNILLYTTEQNQTEVEHRIKFCIKRHIVIKWVSSNVQFIFYHIYYCGF